MSKNEIGTKAIYQRQEVTIAGYVEWGEPRRVTKVWIRFKDGEVSDLVKAKYVSECK